MFEIFTCIIIRNFTWFRLIFQMQCQKVDCACNQWEENTQNSTSLACNHTQNYSKRKEWRLKGKTQKSIKKALLNSTMSWYF